MTDKEMIEQKTKEFQDCISGVMSKLYQQGSETPDMSNMDPEMMSKMASQMGDSAPTIDEVD